MQIITALLIIVSTSKAATTTTTTQEWKQDRFAISFWVDPIVPVTQFNYEYSRIAQANFTVLLGGFGATTPDTVKLQIAAAKQNNLAPIPSICNGKCANLKGAWGFQITDEPPVSEFNNVAKLVADAKAAGQMAFVNLLPNYATPTQLGAATYGDYLSIYMKIVKPNILCVDHYPNFDETTTSNKTKKGYILNLLALRKASMSVTPSLPFWNFFNSMPYQSYYDVSESQLRWQIWTSVAIGSRGVLYFCYWTPNGFTKGQAIMTPTPSNAPMSSISIANQSPSHKYYMVQRINSKLKVLGNWLLKKNSSAVVQTSGVKSTQLFNLNWDSINGSDTGINSEFMLGCYDNNETILLVNQDSNHPALATVHFSPWSNGTMYEVDPMSGIASPALDDAPLMSGFQIALIAGDARLFTWIK